MRTKVMWPAHWRLPAVGESVHISTTVAGFIETVEWDPIEEVVRLMLR